MVVFGVAVVVDAVADAAVVVVVVVVVDRH